MSSAPKLPKLVVAKILETNYTRSARSDAFLRSIGAQALRGGLAKNLFLKPKRDVFGETKYYFLETNYFNLILIFIIRRTIINIIRNKIRTNQNNSFLKPKRNVFGETNCFNLILIFIIGKNIINIICDKIRTNSLQAKRHCVPSENNSFLQNYS